MILKNKIVLSLILFFLLFSTLYYFINNIKNRNVVNEEKYYLLEKNTNQKKILSQLKSKEIYISHLNWLLASLFHENSFIPKAGEYIIPKNFSVFEIQNMFQKGKTLTRNFTLVEGSTALELERNILDNPYLTGEIKKLKEGIYKPDTYFFKYGYSRNRCRW